MNEAETLAEIVDATEVPEGAEVTETPANDVAPAPANDVDEKVKDKAASRFAALARQEAKARQEREQSRLERESMARERAELDAYRSKLQRIKNRERA